MTPNTIRKTLASFLCVAVLVAIGVVPAVAQLTTGTIGGSVKDAQGGAVPGATVSLTSTSRGSTSDTTTNEAGDFVFPNIAVDTYSIRVQMDGFKRTERGNVRVSPGERVAIGTLVIELGTLEETVIVTGEAPMIQAQSGERSFTVTTEAVSNLPVSGNRNFATLAMLTPGVSTPPANLGGGPYRLGGGGQNTFQIDGVVIMDTGNNGQMLQTNVEAIAEVRIIAQGYNAEFGRSTGMQISGVTKSGTNQFRGSVYDIQRHSKWDSNSWANVRNGIAKTVSDQHDRGYTIGGPIGKPGGTNKLFFFYAHEYRPRISGGNVNRFRVPTLLERQGDFSQSRDQNGALANLIRDASSGLPCVAADTRGCFRDGGVLGRIPSNRVYPLGLNVLKLWPEPNADGLNYNLETQAPEDKRITHQPTIKADYLVTNTLRLSAKYTGQRATVKVSPGSIPGFNDSLQKFPFVSNYSATVDWTIGQKTFFQATWGRIQNQLGSPLVTAQSNKNNVGLGAFPMLYPDAGLVDSRYYENTPLEATGSPSYVDGRLFTPPDFQWGNRIANAPPNLSYPAFLNLNWSEDTSISVTRLMGSHTVKTGFFYHHALKAQNTTASPFQGIVNFGNDTNNPLDSGFGFSNAALGVFASYAQGSKFVEYNLAYKNVEAYIQDNWKVNGKLTLDYGLRFSHLQPSYDTLLQASVFFPEQWQASSAPLLYVARCPNNASSCASNTRQAVNPSTGASLGAGSAAAIGTLVPNTGNPVNGLVVAGDGIAKEATVWPTLAVAPRFGMAYDVTGTQRFVVRGSVGLFFDRPDIGSANQQVTNPPNAVSTTVRNAQLQSLATGITTNGAPRVTQGFYDSTFPKATQWNAGVQMALPSAMSLDVSYVGQHNYDAYSSQSCPSCPPRQFADTNGINFGQAYLPEFQDATLAPSTVPGANAVATDLMRPYRGIGAIDNQWNVYHSTFHSIQTALNRRYTNGLQFGANYTYSISFTGNYLVPAPLRLDIGRDGSYSARADQAEYDELMKNMDNRPHTGKVYSVWTIPPLSAGGSSVGGRVLRAAVNDWQISGVFTFGSGPAYDATFTYNANGTPINLTGTPNQNARIKIAGDAGSGCSSDPYKQFNTEAFSGPTYGSLGMESGRNYFNGCYDHTLDLALARTIRLPGGRAFEIRMDAFNALNAVVYSNRVTALQLNSPTDQTVRNPQFNADGSINAARLTPQTAGFGAVTAAQPMRTLQLQLRFRF